jgi:hypothetical protein
MVEKGKNVYIKPARFPEGTEVAHEEFKTGRFWPRVAKNNPPPECEPPTKLVRHHVRQNHFFLAQEMFT